MIFMEITRREGRTVKGTHETKDGKNAILCRSANHDMCLPYDAKSARALSRRVHFPITVVKEMDMASPVLYQLAVTGERLDEVKITTWKMSPFSGDDEPFFVEILKGATVVKVSTRTYSDCQGEEVTIAYESIAWRHAEGGIEAADSWKT